VPVAAQQGTAEAAHLRLILWLFQDLALVQHNLRRHRKQQGSRRSLAAGSLR
jgi:hypothetical protein